MTVMFSLDFDWINLTALIDFVSPPPSGGGGGWGCLVKLLVAALIIGLAVYILMYY